MTEKIFDMAINGRGIRDTERVLNINKNMNNNTIIQNIFLKCENTTIRKPKVVVFKSHNTLIINKVHILTELWQSY